MEGIVGPIHHRLKLVYKRRKRTVLRLGVDDACVAIAKEMHKIDENCATHIGGQDSRKKKKEN